MSFNYAVSDVSDKIIGEAIAQASSAAKASIESLGMDDLLKKNNLFGPLSFSTTDTLSDISSDCDFDDEDEEIENPSEVLLTSMIQDVSIESMADVERDIVALSNSNFIDSTVKPKLVDLKGSLPQYKKSSDTTIPIYQLTSDSSNCPEAAISPFLKVNVKDYLKLPISAS